MLTVNQCCHVVGMTKVVGVNDWVVSGVRGTKGDGTTTLGVHQNGSYTKPGLTVYLTEVTFEPLKGQNNV